ncbi:MULTISPECIES: NAD(P)-dependent oxidoreductase [Kitasatospora]|uniref:NAD(P)-dependent oxidoreductase n=1 Tax=Kitasatospora cystarginea TaxID=58350 RepID=A0ABP5R9V9_9ACTN
MAALTVGFVGLGSMGRGMAANLVRSGFSVQVWNRSPGPVKALVEQGARPAADLAGIFGNDIVVSMLADDRAVESNLHDPGLLEGARARLHINMATISLPLARRAAELHAEHKIGYLAAPVLGRAEVAEAGKLNILAAGPDELLEQAEPLFAAMGQRTWRLGSEPHQANAAKISANFLLACAIESLAEATSLAEASGVKPADLVELLTNTLFPGPAYTGYGSMISERRYEPAGFRLVLGMKDVNLALEAGGEQHVPLPFGGVLRDAFLDAVAHGDADRDWSAVAEVARRRAGLD